ncbi:MAG TPA: hypothetical protein VFZ13_08245 [Gemmatimonadales bacterium]
MASSILRRERPYDPAGIPHRQDAGRTIPHNDAAGADDRLAADGDPRAYDDRAPERSLADLDPSGIEKDAAHAHEDSLAEVDLRAIVAMERRFDPRAGSAGSA